MNLTGEPRVHPTAFVAPTATLLGDVTVGEGASIWYGCVLRAEEAPIVVGPRTNVQDLSVIHADAGQPCTLGAGVTVGHRAVLHSATVEDGAVVGIGAIVLNGAVVREQAMVGAGAVVPERTVIPERTLAVGVPVAVVRELREEDLQRMRGAAAWYVEAGRLYRRQEARGE